MLKIKDFKPKLKTTQKKIIFLNQTELNKLKDFNVPKDKDYLQKVKDVFLFTCYTGLRYSDVENLKKIDVYDNHFEITTVKTNDTLIIELNNFSKFILEKYKDYQDEKGRALPVISNQKMNEYLKLASIDDIIRETYYKGNKRFDIALPKYKLLSSRWKGNIYLQCFSTGNTTTGCNENYRLGFYKDDDTIEIARFVKRNDIYKIFP